MRKIVLVAAALLSGCSSNAPPVAVDCAEGESACGTSCSTLKADDKHCGSCDVACDGSSACANGACHPQDCPGQDCDPSSVCFESKCVDRACVGVVCPTGMACSQGACVCAPGWLTCNGVCVDPKLDDNHCGACGAACAAGTSCGGGACLPDDCGTGDTCDPLSVCYRGDCTEKACVGVVCPASQECRGGFCGCAPGESSCSGTCVETKLDDNNCGACGNVCTNGSRCAAGVCITQTCGTQTCDPLSVCYQGNCVEAACVGVACPGGKVCSSGLCACSSGKTDCGGSCTATATDVNNCGVCGKQCGANESCVSGQCTGMSCPVGQVNCAGGCVDLQTNPVHCSACGAACGGGRNCVGGVCTCPSGLTFCNGTCVNLVTDTQNCGVCNRACGDGGTCGNSTCSCPSGQQLCNGTCTPTGSDSNNCGQCNRVCTGGQVCTSSTCTCPPGQQLCSGACVDTSNDVLRCGSCTNVCNSGQFCNGGTCSQPFTCQSNFNSGPSDCPVFPLNRNSCGVATTASTQTISGSTTANSVPAWYPLSLASNEVVTLTATLSAPNSSGGANVRVGLHTDAGTEIDSVFQTAPKFGNIVPTLTLPGSLATCNHPQQVMVVTSTGAFADYSIVADRQSTNGRYNVGSLNAADAGSLQLGTSGRVCDLVCGSAGRLCPEASHQYFTLTLPAKKAVVIEGAFRGADSNGIIFDVAALNSVGATICTPMTVIGYPAPVFAKARIINNTAQDQLVTLHVSTRASGENDNQFHLAVGVEP